MARVRIRYANPAALEALRKALAKPETKIQRESEMAFGREVFEGELDTFKRQLDFDLELYRLGGFPKGRAQAEWWIKRHIRQAYLHSFIEGKIAGGGSGRIALRPDEERWLKKLRFDEYRYLKKFLDDIDKGRGQMNYQRRMRMYADALKGPYWAGWALGNRDPRRTIIWRADLKAEHCPDCILLNGTIWSAPAFAKWVRKTGILPGQNVQCLSNCKCRLEERFT